MVDHDQIRERIRQRMEDLGLSLTGLWLKAAGIGQTTIRNFLEGMSNSLTVETIIKLADPLKTSPLWLLTGERSGPLLSADQIRGLVRNAMLEAQPGMTLAEIEPIVSSALHEQLELLQSDEVVHDFVGTKADRDIAAQSRAPTKRAGQG